MREQEMNKQLATLYDGAFGSLMQTRKSDDGVSWPHFVAVLDAYECAPIKRLVMVKFEN